MSWSFRQLVLLASCTLALISCNSKTNPSTLDLGSKSTAGIVKMKAAAADVCARAEEGGSAAVSCPAGQTISKIVFASYGTPAGSCGAYKTSSCNAGTSLSVAQANCVGKASCSVAANNDVFGDPCYGADKALILDVQCSGGTAATPAPTPVATATPKPTATPAATATPVSAGTDVCASANEGGTATLACPNGSTISSVVYANWGSNSGACGKYAKGSCAAGTSASVVQSACVGKASCAISAINSTFGDPCPGNGKTLVVDVKCGGSTVPATPTPTPVATATPTPAPTAPPVSSSGAIQLPVEVFGQAAAVTKEIAFSANASNAASLRMTANNLSYDNKMSVQLNNGPWVSVANANSTIEGAGKAYGGIGGGQNTITLSANLSGGVNGNNILRFRFNGTDGVSSGFRVLSFNLRSASGADLIAASSFTNVDPNTWTAPLNNAADIAAGQNLWRTANLRSSPLSSATALRAKCMDCHAQDGRDLHRFNYSNDSIIQRSIFHGLSETQGKQIASYIRSLRATQGTPGPKCRPWNPPYQPGPGLDAAPIADWACGAGLEAVLANDSDSLSYVFPNGINKSAIATGGRMNIREIPIAYQLPDWKHWLPRIHPKDGYGDTFVNSNLNKMYNGEGSGNYAGGSLRANLAKGGSDYVIGNGGTFDNDLYYWGVEWNEKFTQVNGGDRNLIPNQQKLYGGAQWLVVKNWELAQEFNFETLCPKNWAKKGGLASKVEPRSWCGYWRFVFDASPHILQFPDTGNMFNTKVNDLYVANQWYYLAILLNPGSGAHNVHLPTDWQYAYGLVNDLGNASGRQEPLRKLIYVAKGTQEADNGIGPNDVNKGWTFRIADPTEVWKGGAAGIWKGVPTTQRVAAFNAYLETWLDRSESYPASQWQRIDQAGGDNWCGWSQYRLCWTDYVPNSLRGSSPTVENFATWSYKQIPQMRADGIDGNLLNRYARLMNNLYPNGGYLSLVK
jgi:hypothetical protein